MTYKIQIDDVVRYATKEEAALIDAQKAEADAKAAAIAAKEATRQAVLTKLKLTEEELSVLLG